MIRFVTVLAVLAVASAVPAAPGVAGTWKVTLEEVNRQTDRGGRQTAPRMEVTMVLAVKGHEVSGSWKARESWVLSGTLADDGGFDVRSDDKELPVTADGRQSTVTAYWTIRGREKDGRLVGTARLHFGERAGIERPWTAVKQP